MTGKFGENKGVWLSEDWVESSLAMGGGGEIFDSQVIGCDQFSFARACVSEPCFAGGSLLFCVVIDVELLRFLWRR